MLSLDYLAGLFDGEGCINISHRGVSRGTARTMLRVSLGNTHGALLDAIQQQHGGLIRTLKGRNKPVYVLVWSDLKAENFLRVIRDRLVIKRAEADLAIEYREFQGRSDLYERVSGRLQKTAATVAAEAKFKDRMHALKGRSSTKGRPSYNPSGS